MTSIFLSYCDATGKQRKDKVSIFLGTATENWWNKGNTLIELLLYSNITKHAQSFQKENLTFSVIKGDHRRTKYKQTVEIKEYVEPY